MGDHIGHLGDHKKPYDIMGFEEFRGKLSVRELWVSEWVVEYWGAYATKIGSGCKLNILGMKAGLKYSFL